MKTFHILQLAGFGDTLSAITRLPAVKEKYPNYKIKFSLGGFGKSPWFSKQQLEREGYEAALIKNLTFHNQLPQMRDFIMTKFVKEDDRFEDWSFCDEIFSYFCDFHLQILWLLVWKHNLKKPNHLHDLQFLSFFVWQTL